MISIERPRRSNRAIAIALRAWLAVTLPAMAGCSRPTASAEDAAAPPGPSAVDARPEPAGEAVTAMLGGLRTGDELDGYHVTEVVGVRSDGGVTVQLVRGGAAVKLLVTIAPEDDEPRAPARTEKYAVYYENVERGPSAPEEDCQRLARALARRIEAVEGTVPVPPGMKRPRRAGQPA